jgi:hypothetical protein
MLLLLLTHWSRMERTVEGSSCQTARVQITAIQSISTNTFCGKR